jgi:hypothetical protein
MEKGDHVKPLKKMSKVTSYLMTKVIILDTRIVELKNTVKHLNKKQSRLKAQLQMKKNVLSIEEA